MPHAQHKPNAQHKPRKELAWPCSVNHEDVSHQYISSYFIGPQAENLSYFEDNIRTILQELKRTRTEYFPEDGVGIPSSYLASSIELMSGRLLEIHH